eukprot:3942765-Pleurochrysis_carterae.AAC.1
MHPALGSRRGSSATSHQRCRSSAEEAMRLSPTLAGAALAVPWSAEGLSSGPGSADTKSRAETSTGRKEAGNLLGGRRTATASHPMMHLELHRLAPSAQAGRGSGGAEGRARKGLRYSATEGSLRPCFRGAKPAGRPAQQISCSKYAGGNGAHAAASPESRPQTSVGGTAAKSASSKRPASAYALLAHAGSRESEPPVSSTLPTRCSGAVDSLQMRGGNSITPISDRFLVSNGRHVPVVRACLSD